MNLELKDFQERAAETLLGDLQSAKAEIAARRRVQALTLSAPTASGKTVIITAVSLIFPTLLICTSWNSI